MMRVVGGRVVSPPAGVVVRGPGVVRVGGQVRGCACRGWGPEREGGGEAVGAIDDVRGGKARGGVDGVRGVVLCGVLLCGVEVG